MRHRTLILVALLAAPLLSCGSSTAPPPDVGGAFGANPFRFDSMSFDLSVGTGGSVGGSGRLMDDTGQHATFALGGRYPEVTFTVSTTSQGLIGYDASRFRGVFRGPDEIVGTLDFAYAGMQDMELTFRRLER